ncbi:hypothetical protein PAXRUDRAFT_164440, partial [Paxillus rubicundulus Ve08.2h10]
VFVRYYSDPLNVPLFFKIGKDGDGLTLYCCCHGTNDVEGGVHQNLIQRFQSFNISARRALNMILEYVVQHNMQYVGHFDIVLKNRVASLRERAASALHEDVAIGHGSWVNGDNYKKTNEPFGLQPFNETALKCSEMLPFSSKFLSEHKKVQHQHLSKIQGTRFAALPVHTREEHTLFQAYADSLPLFNASQQPNFIALASLMNSHADGMQVFYKVYCVIYL